MRFLGLDYGRKRVGLALSDEGGRFAYPLTVLPNETGLIDQIKTICREREVGEIVLGESLTRERRPNPLMKPILRFKERLSLALGLPIIFEDESMTTAEAAREIGRDDRLDARAAAIILRNYLARRP
ncbi:MAG: Holliday junction resolvase RuvX [Patescibacteria group bacterium]